jgi:hypothetical protein
MQLFAQGTWKRMADFPVMNRSTDDRMNSFVVDGKMYIMYARKNSTITEVWMFDSKLNSWTQKKNFSGPTQKYSFGLGIDNSAYFGLGNNIDTSNGIGFWLYNSANDNWAPKMLPAKLISGKSFEHNGKGYFGLGHFDPSIWVYNSDSNNWQWCTDFPYIIPISGSFIFRIGDKVYFGAGVDNLNISHKIFYSFDPITKGWIRLNNLPNEYFFQGFSICEHGYAICSTNDNLYIYDYLKDVWTIKGIRPKMFPKIVYSIGKKAYLGLGEDSIGNPTNILWEYTPDDSCTQFSGVETAKTIEFSLFPNPVTTEFYLQINNPTHEAFTFNLYQSNGLLVRTEIAYANEPLRMTKDALVNGLYFYQITMGSKHAVGKLVLE